MSGFVRPANPSTPVSLSSSSSKISQASSPREVKDVIQSRQLIGIIIEKICKCAEGDESIQAFVVKVF